MYSILKRLYEKGLIDELVLENCVTKSMITETQKNEIVGG